MRSIASLVQAVEIVEFVRIQRARLVRRSPEPSRRTKAEGND